jgi:hypothetical protein
MVGVEQDRGGRHCSQPAVDPESPGQCVERDAQAESDQVLHDHHERQTTQVDQRTQYEVVADRVELVRLQLRHVRQVVHGVRVDDRRPVGDRREHAEQRARHQEDDEQPVLTQYLIHWSRKYFHVRARPSASDTLGR